MSYNFAERADEYDPDTEFHDQKQYRRSKRAGGKHRRDSFEARDQRRSKYDDWY